MKTDHLTDEELQQFVLDRNPIEPEQAAHITACTQCTAAVAAYRMLFTAIEEEPAPAFDFDLTAAVWSRIEPRHAQPVPSRFLVYLYCILFTGIAGGAAYYFLKDQQNAFKGISLFLIFTVIVVAAVFVVTQVFEMFKKYQQQINILNFE